MIERTRTSLIGIALALGFVSPFLVGFVAERQLRGNHWPEPPDRHYGPTFENAGVKYALDFKRALARGKLKSKPVLLYFTGENSTNTRKVEIGILSFRSVTERLRKFECSAVFIDHVPIVEAKESSRLLEENQKLQLFTGDVSIPKFVVVSADFDRDSTPDDDKVIATLSGYTDDESQFAKFLDDALSDWAKSR